MRFRKGGWARESPSPTASGKLWTRSRHPRAYSSKMGESALASKTPALQAMVVVEIFLLVTFYFLCNDLSHVVLFVQTGSVSISINTHSEKHSLLSFHELTPRSKECNKPPHHNTPICILQKSRKSCEDLTCISGMLIV